MEIERKRYLNLKAVVVVVKRDPLEVVLEYKPSKFLIIFVLFLKEFWNIGKFVKIPGILFLVLFELTFDEIFYTFLHILILLNNYFSN